MIGVSASGTSAACAVVSGLALLADAAARPERLTGPEFVSALLRASRGRRFPDAAALVTGLGAQ
jgi:hypothetical protein